MVKVIIKRLFVYLLGGIVFGLAFTGLSSLGPNNRYMFGFFQDAAIIGAIYAILFGLALEIMRAIYAKKFNKVKLEIAQTSTILFDSAANQGMGIIAVAGWMFLTSENVIFKSRKKTDNEIIIPIKSIQNIDRYKHRLRITSNNLFYIFVVDDRNKWIEFLKTQQTASNYTNAL